MCRTGSFVCGICIGLTVGACVCLMADPQLRPGKHTVEKTMRKVGKSVDSAIENVADMMD